MHRIVTIFIFLFLYHSSPAQKNLAYLHAMHVKNSGHWYRNMTFVQTTEMYRNDSLVRKATWFETLNLPYDLRIDLDTPSKGNFVLYKKDSVYRFQKNQLRNVTSDTNPFVFFIGGLYYLPFDSVLHYLAGKGYDVNKGYQTTWNGTPVWVVGRNNDHDSSNAIYIDRKNLWFVRIIEKEKGRTLDARMGNHKKLEKGATETRVEIYVNGKLAQVEIYDQVKADVPVDKKLFDPLQATTAKHWYIEKQ
jgi:hypothetical protein